MPGVALTRMLAGHWMITVPVYTRINAVVHVACWLNPSRTIKVIWLAVSRKYDWLSGGLAVSRGVLHVVVAGGMPYGYVTMSQAADAYVTVLLQAA